MGNVNEVARVLRKNLTLPGGEETVAVVSRGLIGPDGRLALWVNRDGEIINEREVSSVALVNPDFVADTFTGVDGANITARAGEVGATWAKNSALNGGDGVLSAGRLRYDSVTASSTVFYSSAVPASANYRVTATLHVQSVLAGSQAGICGRTDTTAGTFYSLVYNVTTAAWELMAFANLTGGVIGSFAQTLTVGQDYEITLDMVGTTIRALVNGTEIISVTNSTVSAAGRAGISLFGKTTATTGLHINGVTARSADVRMSLGGAEILVIEPHGYDGTTPTGMIFYHHGSGETREAWYSDSLKPGLRNRLLKDGYILAGISAGSSTHWGNDTAIAHYQRVHPFLLEKWNVSGVVLVPQSMGGTTAFRSAANPSLSKIKGVYAIYPAVDVVAAYDGSASLQAAILGAWGVANRAALVTATVGKSALDLRPHQFPRIRYRFHHSAADLVVKKTTQTDAISALIAQGVPIENVTVATSGDHGDPSNFDPADASEFVRLALTDE